MKVYGINEMTGENVLLYIECDFCDAKIKPHSEISKSGWKKRGIYYEHGDERNAQVDLCPEHAAW